MTQFSSGKHRAIRRSSQWGSVRGGFESPTNPTNLVLKDIREYRAERQQMNNPKSWVHILRKFDWAMEGRSYAPHNPWGATPKQIEHARKVITRLVSLEKS